MKKLILTFIFFISINGFAQKFSKEYLNHYYTEVEQSNSSDIDGKIVVKFENKIYILNDFLLGNQINAKFFGVKADGVSDDTTNLQDAINFCTKKGLTLFLPTGKIITSRDLNINLDKNASTKFRLIGNGISNTIILNIGEKTEIVLNVNGNYYDMFSMKDFSIERLDGEKPSGGIGIKLNKLVYSNFENIDIFRFKTALLVNDVSSSSFKNVNGRWGENGVILTMEPNGMSNPNLIEFRSCIFNSNLEWGIKIDNAHNVNFYNSLFEDNGKGGIYTTYNNSNGAVSINVNNSYFEANKGYDIYLKSYGQGSHNFYGNTFNRVSKDKFTANNIFVEIDSSVPNFFENTVTTIGNGFFSAGTYNPSEERKAIKIVENNKKVKIIDNNSYRTDKEKL